MTVQYPGPLDKSRDVYIAMDNTSNKNYTIYNTILNKLRSNGITKLHTFDVGPNHLYEAMRTVANKGLTNAIVVYVANGIDPTNIKELGMAGPNGEWGKLWGNDNTGRKCRSLGNDVVIALFYDSCDPTRPSGTCYNKIRTRSPRTDVEDGGYWPSNEKPLDYMKRNKIYIVNRSSNQHNKNNSSFDYDAIKDYTGDKIGQAIADLFTQGQPDENGGTPNAPGNTNTPTVTPTLTPTADPNATKVVATKTITQTYTHPHYERVYKLKTDKNGAFQLLHTLPYKAEYSITMKFGGDKTHNGTTRTIKVQNYAKNSQVFEEKLLHTETTIKYTDNTTETTSTGAKPDTKHWRKVVTTENYENGVIKNKTTKTLYGDLILQEAEQQPDISIPTVDVTNPAEIVAPSIVDPSQMASPFAKQIPTMSNGMPNVLMMTEAGKNFVMVSEKTYTLSEEQYRGVFQRDSKMMQLHDYYVPKYIAFESTDTQTWNVVKREVWNAVEESVMYYMVGRGGCAWPKSITVDFAGHKTSFPKNGDYSAVTINWKAASCQYHYVTDHQNWDDTCGDTSGSVCTQLLHNYVSEQKFVSHVGHYISPDSIAKVLGKYNMGGTVTGGNRDTAAAWLKGRKPFVWHCVRHYLVITDINDEGTRIRIANSAYGLSGIPSAGTKGWGLTSNWHGLYEEGYRMYTYGNGSHVKAYCNWSISDSEKTRLKNFFVSMGGNWKRDNTLKQNEAVRRQ